MDKAIYTDHWGGSDMKRCIWYKKVDGENRFINIC